jgi:hypothetical protein
MRHETVQVIPAQAGIHSALIARSVDSRPRFRHSGVTTLRGNDGFVMTA